MVYLDVTGNREPECSSRREGEVHNIALDCVGCAALPVALALTRLYRVRDVMPLRIGQRLRPVRRSPNTPSTPGGRPDDRSTLTQIALAALVAQP